MTKRQQSALARFDRALSARLRQRLQISGLQFDRFAAATGRTLVGIAEGETGAQLGLLEIQFGAEKEKSCFRRYVNMGAIALEALRRYRKAPLLGS